MLSRILVTAVSLLAPIAFAQRLICCPIAAALLEDSQFLLELKNPLKPAIFDTIQIYG
jgi:hypothetical protein